MSMMTMAASSPATHLYRHALESIFSFCSLRELGSLLCVHSHWQSAVRSMGPVNARVEPRGSASSDWLVQHCARGPLARHVVSFENIALTCAIVQTLGERLPRLRSLDAQICELDDATAEAVEQWNQTNNNKNSTLATRAACAEFSGFTRVKVNSVLVAIARYLPLLHTLTLALGLPCSVGNASSSVWCLRPLRDCPALRSLTILCRDGIDDEDAHGEFTATQVADIGSLHWLTFLRLDAVNVERLLKQLGLQDDENPGCMRWECPEVIQWQSIYDDRSVANEKMLYITDGMARVMSRLPRLTMLRAELLMSRTLFPFLHSLGQLCELHLALADSVRSDSQQEFLLELRNCTRLTSLSLAHFSALDSSLLSAVLPAMPLLAQLHLCQLSGLSSLTSFRTPALAASLTDLVLEDCDLYPSFDEVTHLHSLHALVKLELSTCTSSWPHEIPSCLRIPFFPSSSNLLFPHLTRAIIQGKCMRTTDLSDATR